MSRKKSKETKSFLSAVFDESSHTTNSVSTSLLKLSSDVLQWSEDFTFYVKAAHHGEISVDEVVNFAMRKMSPELFQRFMPHLPASTTIPTCEAPKNKIKASSIFLY
jgi:hypothetical protein